MPSGVKSTSRSSSRQRASFSKTTPSLESSWFAAVSSVSGSPAASERSSFISYSRSHFKVDANVVECHRRDAVDARKVTKSGGNNRHLAVSRRKRRPADNLPSRFEQQIAGKGDPASDDDSLRRENVDEAR